MPKPTKFSYQVAPKKFESRALADMPADFQAVMNAWNPADPSTILAVAAHPWKPWARWDYTLTFQMTVLTYELRGHVHYEARTGMAGFNAGPGNFWVSGIDFCSGSTPSELVDHYRGVDVIAEAARSKLALAAKTATSSSSTTATSSSSTTATSSSSTTVASSSSITATSSSSTAAATTGP